MNWNELEKLWQEQPTSGISTPLDERAKHELIARYEKKSRKISRTLLRRDWAEMLACVLVVANWSAQWAKLGEAGWPLVISIGLILGLMAYFAREVARRRKMKLPAHACMGAKIGADLAELRHQRQLLKSVGAWYLGPIAIGVLVELNLRVRQGRWPKSLIELVVDLCVIALIGWGVWWLNQRAVRKGIDPEITELEQLEAQLSDMDETK